MQGAGASSVRMYNYYLQKYADLDIKNPREVLKKLTATISNRKKTLSLSYIKGIISAIIWKLRQENAPEEIMEDYRFIISNIRGKMDREARTHKNVSGYIPKWDEIITKREQEKQGGRLKNHLILSLYTYNPPRRILDYVLLKIAMTPPDAQDKAFNYYLMSNNTFIFNVFKTAKTIGQQNIDVPHELGQIMDNYIKSNDLKSGDLLLGFHNYLQINYILKKILGCGVDNIRHSHANFAYKEFTIPTNEFMSNLAYKMGHSLETNLLYRKI